jgi:hypothetical protein
MVVGVNCSEYQNIDHPPGPGFGTQSKTLADAFFDDFVLPNESAPRRVTFDELVLARYLNAEHYPPRCADRPQRGALVKLDLPVTAEHPRVELELYF